MPILIIVLLSAIAGIIMWLFLPEALIGYAVGFALALALATATYRILGKKALHSLVTSEVFCKLTGYRATVYNIDRQPKNISVTVYGEGHDYADIVDILQNQMHFSANTSKSATKYAMNIAKGKPTQDIVAEALRYIDGGENKMITGA